MKHILSYSSVIVFLLFASCAKNGPGSLVSTEKPGKGAISFGLSKETIPSGIQSIDVSLQRSGYSSISDSVLITNYVDTVRILIDNVPTGDWKVTVTAKDSAGVIRFTGTATVTIAEDQVAQLTVQMVRTGSGVGGVQITIVWPTSRWQTLSSNPILKQDIGSWDQYNLYISSPIVLKVTSEYQMWYTAGTNYVYGDTQSVAYATSPDGLNWTKHGTVLPRGQAGTWNDRSSDNCTVMYDDGVYKMWFEGCSMSHTHNGIGYAVSGDGVHWTALPNPIMSVSPDKPQVFSPGIVKSNGVYYLYYTVELKNAGFAESIYLATSPDGTIWQDHGKILDKRNSVAWDGIGPFHGRVIVDQGEFKMYYTTSLNQLTSIASATSLDGLNWTFNSWEPDLTSNDTSPWSTQMVGYPCVMRDGGKLKMWFAGFSSSSGQWQIGYAEQ